jgi:hypothetical protein
MSTVLFLLAIDLFVILRITASDFPISIFKLCLIFSLCFVLLSLQITVVDKDNALLGMACSSNNDPHIATFEGQ